MKELNTNTVYERQRINKENHRGGCAACCGYMALKMLGVLYSDFEEYLEDIKKTGGVVVDKIAKTLTFGSIAILAADLGFATSISMSAPEEYYKKRFADPKASEMEKIYIGEFMRCASSPNPRLTASYGKGISFESIKRDISDGGLAVVGLSWPGLYGQFSDDDEANSFFETHAVVVDQFENGIAPRAHVTDPYSGDLHPGGKNPIGDKEYWLTKGQLENALLRPGGVIIIGPKS